MTRLTVEQEKTLKKRLIERHGAPSETMEYAVVDGDPEGAGIRVPEVAALPKSVSVPGGGWWIVVWGKVDLGGLTVKVGWDTEVRTVAYARA